MTTTQQSELLRHLGEHPDGVRLVNELGPDGTKELFRLSFDDVDATNLRKNLFEKYQNVDADTRADFAQYTSDPEVRTSFVRAVGDEATTTQAIQRDLAVLRKFEGEVEVQHFRSADEANARAKSGEDEYFREWYPERAGGPEPLYDPYPKSGLIIDAKIQQPNKVLVRAYSSRGSSNFLGAFFTDGEDMLRTIRSSNEDIEGTYALPEGGKDKAAIYQVEEQTTVRISTVGRNDMGPGGGIQFEVREPSVKRNTEELSPSDFPGQFPEREVDRTELEQILEEYIP